MDSTRAIRLLVRQNNDSIRDIILGPDIHTVSGYSERISKGKMLDLLSAFNLAAPEDKKSLKTLCEALRRSEEISEIRSSPKLQSFFFTPEPQFDGCLLVDLSISQLWKRISAAQDAYRNPIVVDLTDVTGTKALKSALTRLLPTP